MVSRRTLFIISMMMAVLFFLFVFSGVAKEQLNDYDTNQFVQESQLQKNTAWSANKNDIDDVVLIGCDKDSKITNVVQQFCTYNKKKLKSVKKLSDYKFSEKAAPQFILLDSNGIDYDKDIEKIVNWANKGVNIIFCNLPKPSVIANNYDLSRLLGIQAVYQDKTQIKGVKLFNGFLLGGDSIYEAKNAEEEKQQDFDLEIPWYQITSGTKTYMVGIMDEEEVENEYLPAIIWRNSYNTAKVFAVNGDYMSQITGIGILSAMFTETMEYNIYPIVNAQNLSAVNFPGMAIENNEQMMDIYSRSQVAVFKDVVMPTLLSTVQKNHNKMTCLMMPQYDYSDVNEPLSSELVYYLKSIKEAGAEAGISTSRKGNISVKEKLERDRLFFVDNSNEYEFAAYYAAKNDIKATARLASSVDAQTMRTITTEFDENNKLISYVNDDTTLQMATNDGFSHTYMEDFRTKSLETALGYTNICVDMKKVAWPENEEERWEKLADKFSKYTNTYWQPFKMFEQTTLSESDRRVRNMLSLDYETSRDNDTVNLNIENSVDTSWFILRTHGEEIEEIKGGSFVQIETDAYIIQAEDDNVQIKLKDVFSENYFYLNN